MSSVKNILSIFTFGSFILTYSIFKKILYKLKEIEAKIKIFNDGLLKTNEEINNFKTKYQSIINKCKTQYSEAESICSDDFLYIKTYNNFSST